MASGRSKGKYSIQNINVISTISMSLVLYLVGTVVFILFAAQETATEIKENINLSLILDDKTPDATVKRIEQYLINSGYAKSCKHISKEDALKEHIAAMGENPEEFLGYNPLMASLEVKLNAHYTHPDSVSSLENKLKIFENIERVAYQKDIVSMVNDNIKSVSLLLITLAGILLIISFTLINNTIKVSIYSNRFLINTMKLVGATAWFIRKPYIRRGMTNGFFAAIIALLILLGTSSYMQHEFSMNFLKLSTSTLFFVVSIVILTGILLTGISSYVAVGRYLKMRTNEMYFV